MSPELAIPSRPLGVALAQLMARYPVGRACEQRLRLLNRVYADSSPIEQLRCRAELLAIRRAKAGVVEVEICA